MQIYKKSGVSVTVPLFKRATFQAELRNGLLNLEWQRLRAELGDEEGTRRFLKSHNVEPGEPIVPARSLRERAGLRPRKEAE